MLHVHRQLLEIGAFAPRYISSLEQGWSVDSYESTGSLGLISVCLPKSKRYGLRTFFDPHSTLTQQNHVLRSCSSTPIPDLSQPEWPSSISACARPWPPARQTPMMWRRRPTCLTVHNLPLSADLKTRRFLLVRRR